VQGSWVGEFVAWKRRGGSHGGSPNERSLGEYAYVLYRVEHKFGLNLHTATLDEVNRFLDEYRAKHALNGYIQVVSVIKDALNYLKRKEISGEIRIPKRASPDENIREQLIRPEEIERLINGAPTLRDRLLIELFDELGNRRGEMANLRVKDVQFDQYSAVLWLRGKTGTGSRRVYRAVPDLRTYLNDHPFKEQPEYPLLLTIDNSKPLSYQQIYIRIRTLSKRILKRPIHPHQFRHTRATEDAKWFNDREMMKLNRWRTSKTIETYTHLTMRDVDDKDLVLHGMKAKQEILRPIAETIRCPECHEENAPIAIYCVKCGNTLTKADLTRENEQLKERLKRQEERMNRIEGQFETILKTKFGP
jgi:integrase